jgi:2-phosphoglycerate kinase
VSNKTTFLCSETFFPLEPYDPDADPALKGILNEFKIVNASIDEVVDRLLNEAEEKVLKEDD